MGPAGPAGVPGVDGIDVSLSVQLWVKTGSQLVSGSIRLEMQVLLRKNAVVVSPAAINANHVTGDSKVNLGCY